MKTKNNCSGTKSGSTKNCKTTNSCKSTNSCGGAKKSSKGEKNSSESDSDPSGSYTGNPVGWGKNAKPVQDADDL